MSPTEQTTKRNRPETKSFTATNAQPQVEHPSSVLCLDEPVKKSDELDSGKLFAWFELECELEAASTGAVWLAHDFSPKRHAKQAVLKFLPDLLAGDAGAVEQLKQEVRRRIELKHAGISRFYDLVKDKGRLAIHMEYVEGRSLSELRLARPNKVFEVRDLEKWVGELCMALDFAHRNIGAIGEGIRPDNLIVDTSGSLKLRDLGLEKWIKDSMNRPMGMRGESKATPFGSVQRTVGERPATADDLYLLGATIYELLTGTKPFQVGEIAAHSPEKNPVSMTRRRAELGIAGEAIPDIWEQTVAACLAKDAARRPSSASEAAKRLADAAADTDVSRNSEARAAAFYIGKKWTSAITRGRLRLALSGILLVVVSVLAIGFFSAGKPPVSKRKAIVLETVPNDANVFLDGVSKGKTPLVIEDVAAGEHQLRIERDGYETRVLVVAVNKNDPEYSRFIRLLPVKEGNAAPAIGPSPSIGQKSLPAATPAPSAQASPAPSAETSATPEPDSKPAHAHEVSVASTIETSSIPVAQTVATPSGEQTASRSGQSSESVSTTEKETNLDATKEEVIRRINALPGASEEKKAALIGKMRKARSMERLAVLRFDRGQTILRRAVSDELVKQFNGPEVRSKLIDPTAILVVAGYADSGGNADQNLRFSMRRAENVGKVLSEQAGLPNAIQTIGMGATQLLDSANPDQNRAVEIWVVVPL